MQKKRLPPPTKKSTTKKENFSELRLKGNILKLMKVIPQNTYS